MQHNRTVAQIGTKKLNWRLLVTLIRFSPRTSALARVSFGDEVTWSPTEYLLANLIDLTHILLWFKTQDGSKNRNRPKPLKRPGMVEEVSGVSLGGAGVPREEFAERWAEAVARQAEEKAQRETEKIMYTSRSGKVSMRTQAEIDNFTKGGGG